MLKEKFVSNKTPGSSEMAQFVRAVLEAEAKLVLEKRRRRFDKARWPGAWQELLEDVKKHPYSKLLAKYDYRKLQSLSYMYLRISGGEKKPPRYSRKPMRPDVTAAKIRRLSAKMNASEIATELHTTWDTVKKRAAKNGIKLKNGLTALKFPELTRKKILRFRKCKPKWTYQKIARRFGVSIITVFRRLKPRKDRVMTRKAA